MPWAKADRLLPLKYHHYNEMISLACVDRSSWRIDFIVHQRCREPSKTTKRLSPGDAQ